MEFDDLISFLMGMSVGVTVVLMYAWYQFQILKSQLAEILDQAVQENHDIELEIEVDQGQYFCYNSENKQFVCQGKTALEIRNAFQRRFPDRRAFLVDGDPKIVAQFKAELEANENSTSI